MPKNQCFVVFWFVPHYYLLLLITAQGPRSSPRYEIRRPQPERHFVIHFEHRSIAESAAVVCGAVKVAVQANQSGKNLGRKNPRKSLVSGSARKNATNDDERMWLLELRVDFLELAVRDGFAATSGFPIALSYTFDQTGLRRRYVANCSASLVVSFSPRALL